MFFYPSVYFVRLDIFMFRLSGKMDRLFFQDTRWLLLAEAVYILILIGVCIRVVYDTRSVAKTLGYLLLVIFVPVLGMTFYFSFGINYRKRKIYTKKLLVDESIKAELQEKVEAYRKSDILELSAVIENRPLVALLSHSGMPGSGVFPNSAVSVLQNGEQLFPVLLAELEKAEKHIHIPGSGAGAGRRKAGAGDSQRPRFRPAEYTLRHDPGGEQGPEEILLYTGSKRPGWKVLVEKAIRLLSPFM